MVSYTSSGELLANRGSILPPFERIPKPRRRTELGLLIFVWVIISALYVLVALGAKNHLPAHAVAFLAVLAVISFSLNLINRWLAPHANAMLVPLCVLLNGMGYIEIVRWNPHAAQAQALWTALGVILYGGTLLVVRRTRDLDRFRYIILLAAIVLMLAPLFPVIGLNVNGARLWVSFGGPLVFQPVEIAKILLVIFFASYFADKKELLSIPTARIGNRLVISPKPLIPVFGMWLFAMAILGMENDIGFAMLMFTLFIAMLWIATGRAFYLVIGLSLFALGGIFAFYFFGQVHQRVDIWLNPWAYAQGKGQQLVQSWYSLGSGGIGGSGLGAGQSGSIPYLTSDLIYVAIAEELGFMGSSILVTTYTFIVGAGFNIAQRARSEFARLCGAGLTVILGFQAFYILAGILRILPFTGITLPFVARGGSSLIANYILIALLSRISSETGPDWIEADTLRSEDATSVVARR